jgi:hypothetical protein
MKGINFDVRDGSKEARQWLAVPLPGPEGEPYEYDHQLPIVEETEAWKRAGATAPQVVAATLLSEAEVQPFHPSESALQKMVDFGTVLLLKVSNINHFFKLKLGANQW